MNPFVLAILPFGAVSLGAIIFVAVIVFIIWGVAKGLSEIKPQIGSSPRGIGAALMAVGLVVGLIWFIVMLLKD